VNRTFVPLQKILIFVFLFYDFRLGKIILPLPSRPLGILIACREIVRWAAGSIINLRKIYHASQLFSQVEKYRRAKTFEQNCLN
jgi:hypothetical protein